MRNHNRTFHSEEQQAYSGQLHALRGYQIGLQVSRAVRARRLGLAGQEDDRVVSLRILYLGPAEEAPEALHPERDAFTYTRVCSPFPEPVSPDWMPGFFRDPKGDLWTEYYAGVWLRAPGLFSSGLKLTFEVPEILAEKKPVLSVFCGDLLLHEETLDAPGVVTRVLNLDKADLKLVDYMLETRRLQNCILDEMERICRKYDITWYLICGGLIGILRDGCLIPWDDDLDFAVTRENYEKLAAAVKREWGEDGDFLWLAPENYGQDVFLDFMTRIVYRREAAPGDFFARLQGKGQEDIHFRECADVYILDDASNLPLLHVVKAGYLLLLYTLGVSRRREVERRLPEGLPRRTALLGRLMFALSRLGMNIGSHVPLNRIFSLYSRAVNKRRPAGFYYMSNGYYACFPLRFRKEWFGKGRRVSLDGRSLPVPADAEAYLQVMYKNYKDYPGVWDRKPMHL